MSMRLYWDGTLTSVEALDAAKGVDLLDLRTAAPGTVIFAETAYERYVMELLPDGRGNVRIVGGRFSGATHAAVVGAVGAGGMTWLRRIGVGLAIELEVGGRRVVTASVVRIVTMSRSHQTEGGGTCRTDLSTAESPGKRTDGWLDRWHG
jgi:hypothetical protein